MDTAALYQEQQLLRSMRQTLGNVVRDVTPLGGRPNPLTPETVQGIKDCFAAISERERQIAQLLEFSPAAPYYRDGSQPAGQTVELSFVPKDKKQTH